MRGLNCQQSCARHRSSLEAQKATFRSRLVDIGWGRELKKFSIEISEPDSAMFGFTCVRANCVTQADVPGMLAFAQQHGARVLLARCSTSDIKTSNALEEQGFRLADTLLYSLADLAKLEMPARRLTLPIRAFRSADIEQILGVARVLYSNYFGHYHADPIFDRAKVVEGYVDWARRSCLDETVAQEVFVAADHGRVGGFVTMRLLDQDEGEMVVGGVHPDYAGKGIYRDFLLTGMEWCLQQKRVRMIVSTQVNNYAVQRAWARLGFQQYQSFYTFHKWFQPANDLPACPRSDSSGP
jgi:ribosomal protein S18 acetylase RimI-like enzyme